MKKEELTYAAARKELEKLVEELERPRCRFGQHSRSSKESP